MRRFPWWLIALGVGLTLAAAGGGVVLAMRLVKKWEGLSLTVYQDEVGYWTIGYGHLVKPGDPYHPYGPVTEISQEEADRLLEADMAEARRLVAAHVTVPLTAGQRESLESIMFNVGPGVPGERDGIVWLRDGRQSTLLRLLNAGDYQGAAAEFDKWVLAGGKRSRGLIARRADERQIFETA